MTLMVPKFDIEQPMRRLVLKSSRFLLLKRGTMSARGRWLGSGYCPFAQTKGSFLPKPR
jgi:hypothetical protein